MSNEFESEFDALLDQNDKKKEQQIADQEKEKDETTEFLVEFQKVAASVIRPTLKSIKERLETRGRSAIIKEDVDEFAEERERAHAVSIYFNTPSDRHVSDLNNYAHVSFLFDKRRKIVQVHESTIAHKRSGHSGSGGSLQLSKVTEAAVQEKVMKVLREIY